jgi:hypothetical protein
MGRHVFLNTPRIFASPTIQNDGGGSSNLFAQNQNIRYNQFYERPESRPARPKARSVAEEVGGKSARVSPNRLPKFGGNTLKS